MSKHKPKPKPKHRNAGPPARTRPSTPRAPAAPRAAPPPEESTRSRLLYTAAGAAGTAFVGSFLAREGWAPKTIAGLLTAAGGVASWTSDDPMVRDVGAGAMSAAGGQLALLMFDKDHHQDERRQADANELPPGSLESAFERARARLAVAATDGRRYLDAPAT